ncbi:hypothetical protein [Streptomyces avidinii]|uniref:Signal transduction histidine kinase n=1 Tax=Streptomyces avidinii TaxID=1895 RepID=A0ABS4L3H5_STRAV|nr:hypothetical protein [Streptomyces avidinii]MBP2036651.1 signal transduction histidine kinase [Streptomyces avidinii]
MRRGVRGGAPKGPTERAEALGGFLSAGPTPEGGWIVTATLPL